LTDDDDGDGATGDKVDNNCDGAMDDNVDDDDVDDNDEGATTTTTTTTTTMVTARWATTTIATCYENKVLWYLHTVLTYQSHVTPIVTHHRYL